MKNKKLSFTYETLIIVISAKKVKNWRKINLDISLVINLEWNWYKYLIWIWEIRIYICNKIL